MCRKNKKKPISLLSNKKIEVSQARYDVDMVLHDRYQSFSAELLKLSLAGIGVVGFFLTLIAGDKTHSFQNIVNDSFFKTFCILSLVSLAGAVAFALLHRFFASDGMFHHIRAIKLMILFEQGYQVNLDEVCKNNGSIQDEIIKDESRRNKKFRRAGSFLVLSGFFLALGAALLGAVFIVLLKGS